MTELTKDNRKAAWVFRIDKTSSEAKDPIQCKISTCIHIP